MTALDLELIEAEAEVLDVDEVSELGTARKSSSAASKLADWFNSQSSAYRFVPATALGQRSTREGGAQEHNLDSLRNLAGQVRKYARENRLEVEANAKTREGTLGILFERAEPSYQPGRGRPKGSKNQPAEEAE